MVEAEARITWTLLGVNQEITSPCYKVTLRLVTLALRSNCVW